MGTVRHASRLSSLDTMSLISLRNDDGTLRRRVYRRRDPDARATKALYIGARIPERDRSTLRSRACRHRCHRRRSLLF